jgi:hypothetical protein
MTFLTPEALKRAGDVCRKCRAAILWATTPNGKAMPIEPDLVHGGNIALQVDDVGMLKARVVRPVDTVEAYVAHFTLCPAAEYFRDGGAGEEQGADHDAQRGAKLRALQVRMPFGKFGGQTLEEIDRSPRGHEYLVWALGNLEWRRTDVRDAIAVVIGRES